MVWLIVVLLVLFGPLYWVIRAGVRDGIKMAAKDRAEEKRASVTPD